MASELALLFLLRAQCAASAAVLLVVCLRLPVRRGLGPELAYGLWVLVPIAAAFSAFPPLNAFLIEKASAAGPGAGAHLERLLQANPTWERHAPAVLNLWGAGAGLALTYFIGVEARFRAKARNGAVGPAVVGLAFPRLIVPADYHTKYDAAERGLIREHERAHIRKSHPAHNAVCAVLQILGWCNPLSALAGSLFRVDQELACDAAVLERRSVSRRAYAAVLLKASGGAAGSLSCPLSSGARLLEVRLRQIMRAPVSVGRYLRGLVAVGAAGVLLVSGMWATEPADGLGSPPRALRVNAVSTTLILER